MFKALLATTTSNCGIFAFGGCADVTELIQQVVNSFFAVVWAVAIVFFVYGGLLWITSAGDKNKAETAKQALTNGLIGLVIVLGVNVIVGILTQLLAGGNTLSAPTIGGGLPTIKK